MYTQVLEHNDTIDDLATPLVISHQGWSKSELWPYFWYLKRMWFLLIKFVEKVICKSPKRIVMV